MNKGMDLIKEYVQKVDTWLPYPMNLKTKLLENLKSDVLEVIEDTGEKDPVVAFGDPYYVAKSISQGQDWGTTRADYGIRFWAFLFDQFIIFLAVFIGFALWMIGFLIPYMRTGTRPIIPFITGIFLLFPYMLFWVYGYFVIFEKMLDGTPGKLLLGLSVCDESGVRITWLQAIIRNLTKSEVFLLALEVLIAHYRNTNYQRLLDSVAQTIVVRNIR
jgi:uncharacterized RDD family membrane protein YckC